MICLGVQSTKIRMEDGDLDGSVAYACVVGPSVCCLLSRGTKACDQEGPCVLFFGVHGWLERERGRKVTSVFAQ